MYPAGLTKVTDKNVLQDIFYKSRRQKARAFTRHVSKSDLFNVVSVSKVKPELYL